MKHNALMAILLLLLSGLALIQGVLAEPVGASLTSNSTDYGPSRSAIGLTHNRSTITTVVLDAVQQNRRWKAYVGNVTGRLTLDDSANNTVYDWTGAAPIGEVYASRSGSLSFSSVQCASGATIVAEQAAVNMTGTETDSILNTFNSTDHTATIVAGTMLSNCNMTSLYVNNASQGKVNTADFQEFLMQDAGNNLVYVARIKDNTVGYNGRTYDFQMIVAESHIEAPKTYYFYIELG